MAQADFVCFDSNGDLIQQWMTYSNKIGIDRLGCTSEILLKIIHRISQASKYVHWRNRWTCNACLYAV